jgi:hypothetical protein
VFACWCSLFPLFFIQSRTQKNSNLQINKLPSFPESDRRTPFGNQLILLLVEKGISAEES